MRKFLALTLTALMLITPMTATWADDDTPEEAESDGESDQGDMPDNGWPGGDRSGERAWPEGGRPGGGTDNEDADPRGGRPGGSGSGDEGAGPGGGWPGGGSDEEGAWPGGGDSEEGAEPGDGTGFDDEFGGMPEGAESDGDMMPTGGAPAENVPGEDTSRIYIDSEDDLSAELEAELANFTYADDNYENSGITFNGYTGTATIGGGELEYGADDIKSSIQEQGLSADTQNATDHYLDYLGDDRVSGFIVLGAAEGNADSTTPGNAITTTAGTVYVEDMYAQVSGSANAAISGRYGMATMGNSSATSVVKDSCVIQTGQTELTSNIEEPGSNSGLLISGHGRANFSAGNTSTYYINSSVVTEGWAAMSTDSASNGGLYLYAYNSDAIAENGGYGVYADSSCNDYLYGSRLTSAELGMIISNNGSITMSDTDAAPDAVDAYLESEDKVETNTRSTVTAGRNDVQIHSPGMSMEAEGSVTDSPDNEFTLNLAHTDLITTADLETTEDYAAKYGDAVAKYLDLVDGANILVKSTYGTITLDDVTATSSRESTDGKHGILLMTALNSDSSSRYVTDGDVTTVTADISNCEDLTGDILNFDYQRAVDVNLSDSQWSGTTYSLDQEEWNAYWGDLNVTENSDDDAVYWILGDDYVREGGTDTTLDLTGSTWNVTGESDITSLTMDENSRVVVGDAATLTIDSGLYAGTYKAGDVITAQTADNGTTDLDTGNSLHRQQIDAATVVPIVVGCILAVVTIVAIGIGFRRMRAR